MVHQNVTYDRDLSCLAIHTPSGTVLRTDAPVDNQGLGRTFSPTDLLATSLATCMLTTAAIVGRRNGIEMGQATAEVEKHMTTSGPRRVEKLVVRIKLPNGLEASQIERLQDAAASCPVKASLHPDVKVEVVYE